ncbi:MAG TPA: cell division protein ZapA [Bacteroidales bacterium]|nr:cell division protein ZapA [Bacteroidales bacterium]
MKDDTFRIELYLAEKYYPLRIKRSKEEAYRKAAKLVNDAVTEYRNKFGIRGSDLDIKDILAMVACHFAFEKLEFEKSSDQNILMESISKLDAELEEII